jgi:hypothetical protein
MVLENARHEGFARELARGKSLVRAYVAAGYAHNRPNASRLAKRPEVRARVAELHGRLRPVAGEAMTAAQLRVRLLEIAALAEAGVNGASLSVARASLMDAARINGLLEKRQGPPPGSLEDLLARMEAEDEAEEAERLASPASG